LSLSQISLTLTEIRKKQYFYSPLKIGMAKKDGEKRLNDNFIPLTMMEK
jgi:hypothetical protein